MCKFNYSAQMNTEQNRNQRHHTACIILIYQLFVVKAKVISLLYDISMYISINKQMPLLCLKIKHRSTYSCMQKIGQMTYFVDFCQAMSL